MAFLVGGANSSAVTAYDIDNSLRLNDDDSAYLSWTPSTATNDDKLTFSFWVKRGAISGSYKILTRYTSSDDRFYIAFWPTDKIYIYQKVGGVESFNLQTNRLFRDPSAWYHIVIAFDTTQGTEANRIKLYVNGTQETSFSTSNYPTQNLDLYYQTATSVLVKIGQYDSSQYYDGHFADFYFIDGTQYAASDFGETDEDSGIWKPKKASVTYGTNGFFMEFKQTGTNQDSSGMGADTSGEDNHLAVTNLAAIDQCTDTPTNNFCTLNPLNQDTESLSEGNLKIQSRAGGSGNGIGRGTIGFSSGKWYAEYLYLSGDVGAMPGISPTSVSAAVSTGHFYAFHNGNKIRYVGATYTDDGAFGDTLAADDILGIAMDADNNTIAFYKNNVLQGGGNAYTGLTDEYTFSQSTAGGTENYGVWNFGNPAFSISSGNADANGYGNFEYEPPNGFYALCTKNLAEYG